MNHVEHKHIRIAELLNRLKDEKRSCEPDHPFRVVHQLRQGQHHQVTVPVGGVLYENTYARAVRGPDGHVINLVLFPQTALGHFEQILLHEELPLGCYADFGKLADGARIWITSEVVSAAHLAAVTKEPVVAALHPQNIESVILALRTRYPTSPLALSVDWTDGGQGQPTQLLPLMRELSCKHGVPYVTSGSANSFAELARTHGEATVKARLEQLQVPSIDAALAGMASVASTAAKSLIASSAIAASVAQDGNGLLRDLVASVRRVVVTTEAAAVAMALWIVFTHVFQRFAIAPLLVLSSPDMRCGKTNALTLLTRLCRAPFATSNMSESAIYRVMELMRPTLLIDEGETFIKSQSMTGILNSGYKAAAGSVVRVTKNGVEQLNTFGPKAIALIGELPQTLMDRAIHVRLQRKLPDERVQSVRDRGTDELTCLQGRLIRWAEDHRDELIGLDVEPIKGLDDRANDNAAPLLAIAMACGGDWQDRAVEALKRLAMPGSKPQSDSTQLLEDVRQAFELTQKERLPTVELLRHLNSQLESPWPTYSRGRELSARDLAELLGRYGIKTIQFRNEQDAVVRGYSRHDFNDAFLRYLR